MCFIIVRQVHLNYKGHLRSIIRIIEERINLLQGHGVSFDGGAGGLLHRHRRDPRPASLPSAFIFPIPATPLLSLAHTSPPAPYQFGIKKPALGHRPPCPIAWPYGSCGDDSEAGSHPGAACHHQQSDELPQQAYCVDEEVPVRGQRGGPH